MKAILVLLTWDLPEYVRLRDKQMEVQKLTGSKQESQTRAQVLSCTISQNFSAFHLVAATNAKTAIKKQSVSVLSCFWQCGGAALGQYRWGRRGS